MRILCLVLVICLLASCSGGTKSESRSTLSGNDVRLVDIDVDARDFSTTNVEISTCPKAMAVGNNSCGVVAP